MYWNLRNLVERNILQQAEVDRQQHTNIESRGTCTTLSWSKGHRPPNLLRCAFTQSTASEAFTTPDTSSTTIIGNRKKSSNHAKEGARVAPAHVGQDHAPLGMRSKRRSSPKGTCTSQHFYVHWFHKPWHVARDYRLACRMAGIKDDHLVIQFLAVHLSKEARVWLRYLLASTIHD
jgi:hypothetical protein